MAHGGLRTEAIEDGAKNFVVVEPVDKLFIARRLVRHGAVHNALIQIGSAQAPDPAGEHNVVAVVHLGKVIEGAGLLGKRQHVFAAVMLDSDIAFLDIDVRRAIFAHRPELHQMAIGPKFAEGKKQIQGSDDIIYLCKHRVLTVDHRVWRGALLGKVHHSIRREPFHGFRNEIVVANIAGEALDILTRYPSPRVQPLGHGANRRQRLDA
jgi:hypothetical protein